MPEILKGGLSVLIHIAIGLTCCILSVFFFHHIDVVPPLLFNRKLTEVGILCIQIMPSLLVSAILIGYAVIFGTCGQNTVPRFSKVLLRYLKEVFIVLSLSITVYIVLVEVLLPSLFNYRRYSDLKTQNYYDFLKEADSALKDNNTEKAYHKVKAALGIWKDSTEALQLLDTTKILHESYEIKRKKESKPLTPVHEPILFGNLTAESALSMSEQFIKKYDFYTAHYYATQAYKLSAPTTVQHQQAARLAARAWGKIEKGITELTAESGIRLYREKQLGYEMLQQGNTIKAYYQFIRAQHLLETEYPLKKDPDIDRFIELSRKKLLEKVFFFDETNPSSLSEVVRGIHFTVPAADTRGEAKIMIAALAYGTTNDIYEIYGRDCEITQYAADNSIIYKAHVPFVKFIAAADATGKRTLRMLFHAVDRHENILMLQPSVQQGLMPASEQASITLPFSFNDFELIIAANEGEKSMTLPQLYTFRLYSAQYGFPAKIYHQELLARISDVFVIIIISIYMLVLAWRFRIPPHQNFKGAWGLSFPFFCVMAAGLVETGRYCARLMITLFTDTVYSLSPVLVLCAYIVSFTGVCFLFIAQRSEA